MKILAMDIGAGTQDILLYDSTKRLENCIKMVLPSPSVLLSESISLLTEEGSDLFLSGYTVGGGLLSKAIKSHLASGGRVMMTPRAAYSVRNNLEDVADLGIEITEKAPAASRPTEIELDELDLHAMEGVLQASGETIGDLTAAAVAVQDHGAYGTGESNRKTRLSYMRRRLETNPDPVSLSYLDDEIPDAFPRMVSARLRLAEQLSCEHLLVMDTAPAAVAGCLTDRRVSSEKPGNLLLINAGNGHTLACLLGGGKVIAVFEHHTKRLEPAAFASYLEAFCSGTARDDDPYMASGHGLFYLGEPPGLQKVDLIAITGPNRDLLKGTGLDVYYPSPGGDMMMTGPMGLVASLLGRIGEGVTTC